jgi:hypothetical protein
MVFFYVGNWMKREEEKKEGMGCLGHHFKPTNENPKGTLYLKSHVFEGLIVICLLYLVRNFSWFYVSLFDNVQSLIVHVVHSGLGNHHIYEIECIELVKGNKTNWAS